MPNEQRDKFVKLFSSRAGTLKRIFSTLKKRPEIGFEFSCIFHFRVISSSATKKRLSKLIRDLEAVADGKATIKLVVVGIQS